MKALIVSDGRRGHLNQSIAFCHYAGIEYEIVPVTFRSPSGKTWSYLLDRLAIYTDLLFEKLPYRSDIDLVVGTGSSTYYAVKTIARRCGAKSVALMSPKGFRKDFDLIFSQAHDGGCGYILPVNFAYTPPLGEISLGQGDVALIVGGNSRSLSLTPERIKEVADFIFSHFPGKKVVTTSPRTPREIEEIVEEYRWDYQVIFSREPINPIGDFLNAGYLFVTEDSTSMISEAVSGGSCSVEVIPLQGRGGKQRRMVDHLAQEGYLHIFDGELGRASKKFDFTFVQGLLSSMMSSSPSAPFRK
ncbi:MAG: hypothetical protein GXO19_06830 [Epsilonproteobacteria bacterium]|nr:hypothetical protein [Campylobacterota bacterium]